MAKGVRWLCYECLKRILLDRYGKTGLHRNVTGFCFIPALIDVRPRGYTGKFWICEGCGEKADIMFEVEKRFLEGE